MNIMKEMVKHFLCFYLFQPSAGTIPCTQYTFEGDNGEYTYIYSDSSYCRP